MIQVASHSGNKFVQLALGARLKNFQVSGARTVLIGRRNMWCNDDGMLRQHIGKRIQAAGNEDIRIEINQLPVSRVYCRPSVTADKSSRFLTYFTRSTSSASAGWIILIHVYAARSHAKKYSRSITCARVPSD